ncbi:MAG: hypothetical protein K0R46_3256 [Herbinix sp.]|nr:hypothetical protein [Herbinix sp.]
MGLSYDNYVTAEQTKQLLEAMKYLWRHHRLLISYITLAPMN